LAVSQLSDGRNRARIIEHKSAPATDDRRHRARGTEAPAARRRLSLASTTISRSSAAPVVLHRRRRRRRRRAGLKSEILGRRVRLVSPA